MNLKTKMKKEKKMKLVIVNLGELMPKVEKGYIKQPIFQRDFVWGVEKAAKLIDSIIKEYPIGGFITWETDEQMRLLKNIGTLELIKHNLHEENILLLDGQQRITSIVAAKRGEKIGKKDFGSIYIDLEVDCEDEELVVVSKNNLEAPRYISFKNLMNADLLDLLEYYGKEGTRKIQDYREAVEDYEVSVTEVKKCPLYKATEIFTRLNVGGKELTLFEIMYAKTYSQDFDLSEKFEKLNEDLEKLDYTGIKKQTVLQVLAMKVKNGCKNQHIGSLTREEIKNVWDEVVDSINKACHFLRDDLDVKTIKMLPYSPIIVVFAHFYDKLGKEEITEEQEKMMKEYFWRACVSGRFVTAQDTKIKSDAEKMESIRDGKRPEYEWGCASYVTPQYILDKGKFSLGTSYTLTLICMLAGEKPRSFGTNKEVKLGGDVLVDKKKKNYHHFFPKDFLNRKGVFLEADHILNITIIDDYVNKDQIRAKAPSDYMTTYATKNKNLEDTLKTHLIGDPNKMGIWSDDYETFIQERALLFSEKLKEKINLTEEEEKSGEATSSEEIIEKALEGESENVYIAKSKDKTFFAKGIYESDEGKEFVVLKGSRASKDHYYIEGRNKSWVNKREELIESGVLQDKVTYYEFDEDYVFGSPGAACSVVMGVEETHYNRWRNKENKILIKR